MKRLLAGATFAVLFLASPAAADHCHYPPAPSHGEGTVDKTRVEAGDCVKFEGDGFEKNATVTITDNGVSRGTVKANGNGVFKTRVCFEGAASVGEHVLQGRGSQPADPESHCSTSGERFVTATVTVAGVRQGAENNGGGGVVEGPDGVAGGGFGRPLPSTGGFTAVEALVGGLLVLFGAAVLLAGKPRRRRSEAAAQ